MKPAEQQELFERIGIGAASNATLDSLLVEMTPPRRIDILFLWGLNCPNCDIAEAEMRLHPERFQWREVRWLQANVYDDPDLATRFGLHGVPVFLVFRGKRPAGRITSWPGTERFVAAIDRLVGSFA